MMSEQNLFAELKPITFDGIDPNKPLVIAGPVSYTHLTLPTN